MDLRDIGEKFHAFGFEVIRVQDWNDLEEIISALDTPRITGKPRLILAATVKGKGISFMENRVEWHGKAPNAQQREQALAELELEES